MSFPRPRQWFGLSVRRRFSTARDLVLPVAFATLVLSSILTPVAVLSGFVRAQEVSSTALTQVDVTPAAAAENQVGGITSKDIERMAAISGVVDVLPNTSVGIYAADGSTWALTLHVLNPANLPPDLPESAADEVVSDSIVVPDEADGSNLSALVGQAVPVSYTRMTGDSTGELSEREVRFAASYESTWQGYGPGVALASEDLVLELLAARGGLQPEDYLATVGLTAVTVTSSSSDQVPQVTAELRNLGFTAVPMGDRLGTLPGIFAIFPQILLVAACGSAILLLLQLSRAVRGSLERRAPEFALLRIHGWTSRDVKHLISLDVAAGSLAGAFGGALAGVLIGTLLVVALVPGVAPPLVLTGALAVPALSLIVAVFCLIVSVVASRRALRTDPFITVMSRSR